MRTMKWLGIGILAVISLLFLTAFIAREPFWLNLVRLVTARYHNQQAAEAAGYIYVSGLDYCFDNPGVGGMGFHRIKTTAMDTRVKVLEPEAMVYAPAKDGRLILGAVEYIVPAEAWDAEGHTHPPMLLGQHFHLNAALGVYVLHAWIWKANPAGVFMDWNPRVACP